MSEKSRRQFLEDSLKSLSLLGISPWVSSFIIQSMSEKAQAQQSVAISGSNKRYIFFGLYAGPPRWFFDLPLTPNGTTTQYTDHFSHTGIGTYVGVQGANDPQAIYKPWFDSKSKYWLPPVWGSNPAGGAFENCLSNAAFIRGFDLEINAHELGLMRNQSPILGGSSIGGLLAEKTNSIFPAATTGHSGKAFKSVKTLSPVALSYAFSATNNPIKTIMSYFSGKAPTENLFVKQILKDFEKYADKNNFSQRHLAEAKEKSDSIVKAGVNVFIDQWKPVNDKYQALIAEALTLKNTENFLDNKDIPLPPLKNGKPDIRTQYEQDLFVTGLSDMRKIVDSQAIIDNLSSVFTSIEILITNGLTQVATVDLQSIRNLMRDNSGNRFALNFDQHFTGSLVSTIATTFYYRSLLSCTESLVLALKAKGIFDQTVIHFGAEFNRNPHAAGSGSDHGFKGSSALIISGMINKTLVVGNIKDDQTVTYKGTWGLAAKHPLFDNQYPIRNNDVVKTICGMLNIPNASNNGVIILKNIGTSESAKWDKFDGPKGEAKNEVA